MDGLCEESYFGVYPTSQTDMPRTVRVLSATVLIPTLPQDAKSGGGDDDEDMSGFGGGKAMTAREAAMEEEKVPTSLLPMHTQTARLCVCRSNKRRNDSRNVTMLTKPTQVHVHACVHVCACVRALALLESI